MVTLTQVVDDLPHADRNEFYEHMLRAMMYRGPNPKDPAVEIVLAELKAAAAVLARNGHPVPRYT